jgi:hypothetical protein
MLQKKLCNQKIFSSQHNIRWSRKGGKKNLIQRAMFALMNKKYGTISIIQFSMCL